MEEIKTKKCTKCGKVKSLNDFHFRRDTKKHRGQCKKCRAIIDNENYRKRNPIPRYKDTSPIGYKRCSTCRKVKLLSEFSKYASSKDKHGHCCKICKRIAGRKYHNENKDKINNKKKESYYNDLEKQSNRKKIYREQNKKEILERERKRRAIRKATDIQYKLSLNLRGRILKAINKQYGSKAYSSIELLGCSIQEVRDHLEKQFIDGMSWDNHGIHGWHIDHIKPCASFDLTDPEQQKKCFHYTNLQPLWAFDNLSKGANIV